MNASPGGRALTTLPTGVGSMAELERDLAALGGGSPDAVARWTTRPSVLRRVALALADGIAPEASRIVLAGEGGIALGAALSLTTGLPFAVVDSDGPIRPHLGEIHQGEEVAVAAVHEAECVRLVERLTGHGNPSGRSVFGMPPHALFSIERDRNAEEEGP